MILVKSFLMSILSFWRTELPPEVYDLGTTLDLVRYQNGKEVSRETFDQNSPKYQSLITFLYSNRGQWKYDVDSYNPDILIRGKSVTINCRNANAIVYYIDANGKSVQFSTDPGSISYCGFE